MKLYVGNLPWSATDSDLEQLFGTIGTVESAKVIADRDSGQSRGFGFVEMSQSDGSRAIAELNGKQMDAREIRVNEAQKKRASSF